MQTIYKYPFDIADAIALEMPRDARILKAECQGDQPCMWALVVPGRQKVIRRFRIFGTGHPIEADRGDDLAFVATWQQPPFVWHMFEIV